MTNERVLQLNFGPHNSTAIGPFCLNLQLDGEIVVKADPEVGFLHRGIEKICERLPWLGLHPFVDRVDYLAPIHGNLAYSLAVEKLMSLDVPKRASQIRVITGELNRIESHLYSIGYLASRLGCGTALMYMLRDREKVNNLFEMLCGARLTYNYIRIGGVSHDVTEGFIEKTYEFLDFLRPKLKEYKDILTENAIFSGRLSNIGVLYYEKCISAAITGPNLRGSCDSSKLMWDLRKVEPYSGYESYDFDFNTGLCESMKGDCFSRYLVRLAEIDQSMNLVRQGLDRLVEGPFRTNPPLGDKGLLRPPIGEAYAAVEGPRGLFGVYIYSDGGVTPGRIKFRPPSLNVFSVLPELLEGHQISDINAIVGSLDIMMSEVDR